MLQVCMRCMCTRVRRPRVWACQICALCSLSGSLSLSYSQGATFNITKMFEYSSVGSVMKTCIFETRRSLALRFPFKSERDLKRRTPDNIKKTESELEFMVELYTTIFYPLNLKHVGYIYGWKLSRGTWCVAGVIQSDSVWQPSTPSIESSGV